MKISRKTYEKDRHIVYTHNKFIYHSSIYKLWPGGASLLEEKYYSSSKPIVLKKKSLLLKKKDYSVYRFFELEFAPEEYLINNSFKLIENEE